MRIVPGASPSPAAASFCVSPSMSTSSTTAVSLWQRGQPADQVAADSFGVDPVEQLLDLVRLATMCGSALRRAKYAVTASTFAR
jgi:hypothetical protein